MHVSVSKAARRSRDLSRFRACLCTRLAPLAALALIIWTATGAHALEHTVRPGENLHRIASEYGTTVEALVALNELADPNRLSVGQRIVVRLDPQIHIVQARETLSQIAARYGVAIADLAAWNGVLDPNRIFPGQELIVSAHAVRHKVARGENVTLIARRYGVTVASIAALNDLGDLNRLAVGQVLLIPPTGGGVVEALAATRPLAYRRSLDRWPVQGTISSDFGLRNGRMHEGIDIAVTHGSPVRAVAPGLVSYADWAGSYGLLVKIDHGGGVETRYAHNSRLVAKPGEYVEAGQIVARAGSTGRSTGPHVHFEIRVDGESVNPRPWLP